VPRSLYIPADVSAYICASLCIYMHMALYIYAQVSVGPVGLSICIHKSLLAEYTCTLHKGA